MNQFSTGYSILRLFCWHTKSHKALLLYLLNTSVCHPWMMVPGTWLSGTPDVFLPTCLHHPVMVNHSNKYELEHLQFLFFSNGVLSIYLFICLAVRTLPTALGLQPWTTGCCAGGLICWEGHVSRRQCSLSFSSSSDAHLDVPVLTAFVYPDQSIRCVISSVFTLTTLSPPSPPLRACTRPFISIGSEDDCFKTLFTIQ